MPTNDILSQAREALGRIAEAMQGAKTRGPFTVDASAPDDLFTWIRNEGGGMLSGTSGRFWISDARAIVAAINSAPSLLALVTALLEERELMSRFDPCLSSEQLEEGKSTMDAVDAALSRFVEESGKP